MPVARRATRRPSSRYSKKKTSIPRQVRTIVNQIAEKKYLQLNTGLITGTNVWAFYSALEGLQQGTGASDRLGNRVFVTAIHYVIQFDCDNTVVPVENVFCEYLVYHNRAAGGGLPNGTDIWLFNQTSSPRNMAKTKQLTLEAYGTHNMPVAGGKTGTVADLNNGQGLARFSIFPKKQITYTSNSGTISDLLKDDYGFAICCNSNVGACRYRVFSTMEYTDY